jgi:hypothetical protein
MWQRLARCIDEPACNDVATEALYVADRIGRCVL